MKPDFYSRIYLWLAAHRWLAIGAALLLAIVAVIVSTRVDLEEDILATLPQHDPVVDDYRYTLRKFRQIDRVYIDVSVEQLGADKLTAAADAVFTRLSTNADYTRVMYRIEVGGQRKVVDFLTGALPNLFTDDDVKVLETKLQPDEIRSYLTTMRRKLAGPEGMVLKDVVAADPIAMSALVVNKVLPLQTGFGDAQIVDGRITSGDGKHVLILAEPKFTSSNSGQSAALVNNLLQLARDVENEFPGVRVASTGGHRMTVDNATLIKGDATRCIFLGMTAMLLLCVTAYRRKWLAPVTFLPSLFGTIIAGAVLVFWDQHISAIATGFATIAIGITVDYGIYVVYHLDNAATDRHSAGKIVGRLLLPTIIGALTIIAAFIVLACSPMHGYQQLGIFGAVGVLMSALFALFVLPLIVPLPKKQEVAPLRFTRWMENFHAWQKRWRPLLLLGVVVLTIVTAFGIKRLRFEGDITKMNGITDATRQDEALIRHTWGDALGMTLVVARGDTPDAALAENDRAKALLSAQTNVAGIFSLASVCPSAATQETNIQRWQNFWTSERQSQLHQSLQQIGGELGFRTNAFAPFWKTVEEHPALLTLDMFRGTPLEQALNERVALGTNDNAISTLIKLNDRSQAGKLRAALPGMILLDQQDFANHIAAQAKAGVGFFLFWTAVAVALIVYLALAYIELVIATLLPLGLGLFWTLGLMGLLGLPIDMMNCVFVIFIIGIGEDYSVFLATSKLDEWRGHPQRIAATSASVMISALTTICGFAVLVFAKHPVLFSMGTTVLLGMACAFAATLVLTPACMDLLLFKNPPVGAPRWWHLLGTIWAGAYLAVSQFFLYYILHLVLKIISPKTANAQVRTATRAAARFLVHSMPFGKFEYRHLTPETFFPPCIVVANHQSAVDVMLAVALPADVRQTAKKRIFDTPILGIGCQVLGHVMVEPNHPVATLQRCRERLAEGASVLFYPEGTRSTDGFVQRFHRGAFELAIELKRDILPVVLCDTSTATPRDAFWFEPYRATMTALPRVTPQNFDYTQGSAALMRHCEKLVRDGLQRQLDELNMPNIVRRKVVRLYRYQNKFAEQFVYWKLKLDPMFPLLDKLVPRDGFILDLGCGYGEATHWLAQYTDGRRFLGLDYDEDKIRVAQRTAPGHPRIEFRAGNLLEENFSACDAILLLDVLHYWQPEKQLAILTKARQALRSGGKLILRDGAKSGDAGHRHINRWEKFATFVGHNQTEEGLHFLTLAEMEAALAKAGFTRWELQPGAGRGSNVLLVAIV